MGLSPNPDASMRDPNVGTILSLRSLPTHSHPLPESAFRIVPKPEAQCIRQVIPSSRTPPQIPRIFAGLSATMSRTSAAEMPLLSASLM